MLQAMLPSAIINKMAREDGYVISLSGQGADEIITRLLPQAVWKCQS